MSALPSASGTLPAVNPSIICKTVSDGAVLFSPSDELYYGLNEVGARVWQLLPPVSSSLDDLCERLNAEYPDAPRATIRSDVESLLDELVQQGLAVTRSDGSVRADGDPAATP